MVVPSGGTKLQKKKKNLNFKKIKFTLKKKNILMHLKLQQRRRSVI